MAVCSGTRGAGFGTRGRLVSDGLGASRSTPARGRFSTTERERRGAHLAMSLIVVCALFQVTHAQVTSERLLRAADEPQNWLTYSGGYRSQRYSALTQARCCLFRLPSPTA